MLKNFIVAGLAYLLAVGLITLVAYLFAAPNPCK